MRRMACKEDSRSIIGASSFSPGAMPATKECVVLASQGPQRRVWLETPLGGDGDGGGEGEGRVVR